MKHLEIAQDVAAMTTRMIFHLLVLEVGICMIEKVLGFSVTSYTRGTNLEPTECKVTDK